MMKKISAILFIAFILHLLISFTFIVLPGILSRTWISKIYKTYLLPGPFFTADRLTTTYNLHIMWRKNGEWSAPVNPSKESFNKYYQTFSPRYLYKTRFLRSISEGYLLKESPTDHDRYFFTGRIYIDCKPPYADSVKFILTRKYVANYLIQLDTLDLPNK